MLLLLDRQAKNLLPRVQNGSEHSSFMGSHILPQIGGRRSLSENVRIKAYSVEMDAVQALNRGLSPLQPRLHKQVHRGGSWDTFRASRVDETQDDPEGPTRKGPEQAALYLGSARLVPGRTG